MNKIKPYIQKKQQIFQLVKKYQQESHLITDVALSTAKNRQEIFNLIIRIVDLYYQINLLKQCSKWLTTCRKYIGNSASLKIKFNNKMAWLCCQKQIYEQAQKYLTDNKSIIFQVIKRQPNQKKCKILLIQNYLSLSTVYYKMDNYEKSQQIIKLAQEYVEQIMQIHKQKQFKQFKVMVKYNKIIQLHRTSNLKQALKQVFQIKKYIKFNNLQCHNIQKQLNLEYKIIKQQLFTHPQQKAASSRAYQTLTSRNRYQTQKSSIRGRQVKSSFDQQNFISVKNKQQKSNTRSLRISIKNRSTKNILAQKLIN